MIKYIDKLSDISRKIIHGDGGSRRALRTTDLPLDHQLTFEPNKDERWTFEDERSVCINGIDVRGLVHENQNEVGVLCGVSHGLYEYQQHVWSKGGKGFAAFNGKVSSLQHSVLGRISNIYDSITGGVHFDLEGDDLWLNNVNVRSVLKLYALRPTEAARSYLEGLKQKVALILSRRRTSSRYDAVADEATRLYEEISFVLDNIPPAGPPRLCA